MSYRTSRERGRSPTTKRISELINSETPRERGRSPVIKRRVPLPDSELGSFERSWDPKWDYYRTSRRTNLRPSSRETSQERYPMFSPNLWRGPIPSSESISWEWGRVKRATSEPPFWRMSTDPAWDYYQHSRPANTRRPSREMLQEPSFLLLQHLKGAPDPPSYADSVILSQVYSTLDTSDLSTSAIPLQKPPRSAAPGADEKFAADWEALRDDLSLLDFDKKVAVLRSTIRGSYSAKKRQELLQEDKKEEFAKFIDDAKKLNSPLRSSHPVIMDYLKDMDVRYGKGGLESCARSNVSLWLEKTLEELERPPSVHIPPIIEHLNLDDIQYDRIGSDSQSGMFSGTTAVDEGGSSRGSYPDSTTLSS